MIEAVSVRRLGGHRLEIGFSDGSIGEHDFAAMVARPGPMLAPLRDADYFARVFVEDGALAWPNGYDLDPIALHREMTAAGELRRASAAE